MILHLLQDALSALVCWATAPPASPGVTFLLLLLLPALMERVELSISLQALRTLKEI